MKREEEGKAEKDEGGAGGGEGGVEVRAQERATASS